MRAGSLDRHSSAVIGYWTGIVRASRHGRARSLHGRGQAQCGVGTGFWSGHYWTGTARHSRGVVDRHKPTIGGNSIGTGTAQSLDRHVSQGCWTDTAWPGTAWPGSLVRLLDRHSPSRSLAVIGIGTASRRHRVARAEPVSGSFWDRHSLTAHCSPTGFRVKHRVFVSHPSYTSNAIVTVSR